MTSNWGSWLICWRAGPCLLRNLHKLQKRAKKNLIKFNKQKHKVWYLGCNKTSINPGWVVCLWERTWDPAGQQDTFPPMKTKCLLGCISKGRNLISLFRYLEGVIEKSKPDFSLGCVQQNIKS